MSRRRLREGRWDRVRVVLGALLPSPQVRRCWRRAGQAATRELRPVLGGWMRTGGEGARPLQAPPCQATEERRNRAGRITEGYVWFWSCSPNRLRRHLCQRKGQARPSSRDGAALRPPAATGRGCAPPQRGAYGQPHRESGAVVKGPAVGSAGRRQARMGSRVHRQIRRHRSLLKPSYFQVTQRNLEAEQLQGQLDIFAEVAG